MSDSLFKKLPEIWKDLDLRVSDVVPNAECASCGHIWEEGESTGICAYCNKPLGGRGLLERFLAVPDAGVARIEDLIAEFLRAHNIEKIRDRFVPLFDPLTGHRWKDSKPYQWNRNRSQASITRASYKGTSLCIEDLAKEYGAEWAQIVDMASTVAVWDRQGVYTQNDDYFYDSDFHHPGVFLLYVDDNIDLVGFLDDFQYIQPAGTKWYIRYNVSLSDAGIEMLDYSLPNIIVETGTNFGHNVYTDEFNFFDFVPQLAASPIVYIYEADGEVGVANAYVFIDSFTYRMSDEDVYLDNIYLNSEASMRQPAIEIEIPN